MSEERFLERSVGVRNKEGWKHSAPRTLQFDREMRIEVKSEFR